MFNTQTTVLVKGNENWGSTEDGEVVRRRLAGTGGQTQGRGQEQGLAHGDKGTGTDF